MLAVLACLLGLSKNGIAFAKIGYPINAQAPEVKLARQVQGFDALAVMTTSLYGADLRTLENPKRHQGTHVSLEISYTVSATGIPGVVERQMPCNLGDKSKRIGPRGSVNALLWVAVLLVLVQMTFALLLSQA